MDMSNLINCPEDIIKEFATLATSKDAFGNPSEWTAIQVFYNSNYTSRLKYNIDQGGQMRFVQCANL